MKKIICIGVLLVLCGCESLIDKGIDISKNTKYGLAKNCILKYAENIKIAYTNYLYDSSIGTYTEGDGETVIVNGKTMTLKINYVGDEINCDEIRINNGKVELDNCTIYGYSFNYINGNIIDKDIEK